MLAMRWCMRLIGIVSTAILARLLVPEDFGIIAMAMIVVGFAEMFAYLGVDLALIQKKDPTRDFYDTAWTINILQGAILTAILFLLAPFIGGFFDEPRVVLVIQFLAFRAVAIGMENIGTVAFRKELDFAKEFRFGVCKKILSFTLTVSLAFWLENYWAIVIGLLGGAIMDVLLSYFLHPFRPKLSLSKFTELWAFSVWILIRHVVHFALDRIDEFIVGKMFGTRAMGGYYISAYVGTMPANEVVMPLARGLYPSYVKMIDDPPRLVESYLKVLGMVSVLCMSICFGMVAVSHDLIHVFLGERWLYIQPVFDFLVMYAGVFSITSGIGTVMMAMDRFRPFVLLTVLHLAVLVTFILIGSHYWGVKGVAAGRLVAIIIVLPLMFLVLKAVVPVTFGRIIFVTWRPLVAGAAMFFIVRFFHIGAIDIPALTLAMDVMVGVVSFVVCLFLLWIAQGRPEGPENVVVGYVLKFLRRKANG